MRRDIVFTLVIFLALTFSQVTGLCIEVSAKSAVVIDTATGRILYSKNETQKLPMASTTKIATAIAALENSSLNEIIKTSPKAAHVEGSSIWLSENEQITMENALYGLMLESGNDAAAAIAEHVGKGKIENFIELMNTLSKKIGANNTNFANPHGLDNENHFTTAYDLALITRYGFYNYPKFGEIVSTKERKIPWEGHNWNRFLKNHNKLLWQYENCNGVKTGFTKKAGRCLVSSATRNGMQLIVVTLNAGDDWNDHKKMLDYCFETYKPFTYLYKGQYLKTLPISNGKQNSIKLLCPKDIIIPIASGEEQKINIEYNLPDKLIAPITYSQQIGFVNINLEGKKISSFGLKSQQYIEEYNIKEQFKKTIRNWILIFI